MPLDEQQVNEAFREFNSYLRILARVQLDPRLHGKLDLSGLVQHTLLEAHQCWEKIHGWTRFQKAGWLRRALTRNLADAIKKLRTQGRDVFREQSLGQVLDESSARLDAWLVAEQDSPSEIVSQQEEALRLAEALERIPEAEREAIVLQRWHGWTLARIAEHFDCTTGVVAGLLDRGLKHLRKEMTDSA